jgi:hypothetical protein
VESLQQEKLVAAIDAASRAAAVDALRDRTSPMARTFFVVERGQVIEPALLAPAPRPLPRELVEAERLELIQKRPDLAIEQYRSLV